MDLLWKNPRYFMESYLNLSFGQCLIAGCLGLLLGGIVCVPPLVKKKAKKIDFVTHVGLSAIYFSLLLAVTLFGQQRGGARSVSWNPFYELRQLVRGDPHVMRGTVSNIILFIPFGAIAAWRLDYRRTLLGICMGLLLSGGIEILQYAFCRGCMQTADLICNGIGTAAGVYLACLYGAIKNFIIKNKRRVKNVY